MHRTFFERDALEVAGDLLGCEVAFDGVRVRLTEVEAYRFPGDTANHARMGRTDRNAPMWGPAGHLYVYLCYGLHQMVNVVTGPEGHAAAVLLRAAEPVEGAERIRARRGGRTGPTSLDGPGKLGAALGLSTAHSGARLYLAPEDAPSGAPVLHPRRISPRPAHGPRIGIDYAAPADRLAPWRLADADSAWVGHRRGLRPADAGAPATPDGGPDGAAPLRGPGGRGPRRGASGP
jgi:DNA-3-methyladenine glycosylase